MAFRENACCLFYPYFTFVLSLTVSPAIWCEIQTVSDCLLYCSPDLHDLYSLFYCENAGLSSLTHMTWDSNQNYRTCSNFVYKHQCSPNNFVKDKKNYGWVPPPHNTHTMQDFTWEPCRDCTLLSNKGVYASVGMTVILLDLNPIISVKNKLWLCVCHEEHEI